MHIQIKFLTIPVSAVVAHMFLNSIVNFEVLLQIALLSKLHTTASLLALVRFVLRVAAQVREVFGQRRNHAGAALEVAGEDLELPLRISALDVVHCVVIRGWDVAFVAEFEQVALVIVLTGDLGRTPVGVDLVSLEELGREQFTAGLVREFEQSIDIRACLVFL